MNKDNKPQQGKDIDTNKREDQSTIVHETIPGTEPAVKGGDSSAKEKAGKSTVDEDI